MGHRRFSSFVWLMALLLLLTLPVSGADPTYEPVHNSTNDTPNVKLSALPAIGRLTPGRQVLVNITGAGRPGGTEPSIIVLNDTGFDITDLHWRIVTGLELIGGQPAVGGPVPK